MARTGPGGGKLTLREARQHLRGIGHTLRHREGEYRVSRAGAPEAHAYYTNDLQDAVDTAHQMHEAYTAGRPARFGFGTAAPTRKAEGDPVLSARLGKGYFDASMMPASKDVDAVVGWGRDVVRGGFKATTERHGWREAGPLRHRTRGVGLAHTHSGHANHTVVTYDSGHWAHRAGGKRVRAGWGTADLSRHLKQFHGAGK